MTEYAKIKLNWSVNKLINLLINQINWYPVFESEKKLFTLGINTQKTKPKLLRPRKNLYDLYKYLSRSGNNSAIAIALARCYETATFLAHCYETATFLVRCYETAIICFFFKAIACSDVPFKFEQDLSSFWAILITCIVSTKYTLNVPN